MNDELNSGEAALSPESSALVPPWYALRVRSNFEKKASGALALRGMECFLPSYKIRRNWTDRVKVVDQPLFPGYIFARFQHPRDWLMVMQAPGVVQIVGQGQEPTIVEEAEIETLRKLVNSSVPLFPRAFLKVGQKVRIEHGPLAGTEGILEKFQKDYRLVVSISLLQRSVAAEMDADWVKGI
jgi:transcription antitermination factor NusG